MSSASSTSTRKNQGWSSLSYLTSVVVISCAVLFAGPGLLLAQDGSRAQEAPSSPDEQEDEEKYPEDQRRIGTNDDTVARLNKNLPKTDSLLDWSFPEGYSRFKRQLNEKAGVKFGLSYQTLYQTATESLTDKDSAWGGWFLVNFGWTAFNRAQDWQGDLVFALDGRHTIKPSTHATPGLFNNDTGSLWPTDAAYFNWDVYPAVFFWEQWPKQDRFAFRVGQQAAISVLDPLRFDELRTSFTSPALAAAVSIIPIGPPGLAFSAKWWPIEDSELYVRGIVIDINAPIGEVDWSGLFDEQEVFAGVEIGYDWLRGDDDYDHAHLTLWHADEASTAPFPTKAGWGVKLSGSKQWSQIVGFGNYAYNTAEGGGFGVTNSRRAVNAGVAYMQPLGIQGELALGGSWAEPLDDGLRNQSGLEAYWKLLVTSDLWVTPGLQYIVNPSLNPETDSFVIAQVKASLFF